MSLNPNKIYYSISEVCTELDLEQHVLRYWENEFSQLRPKKNRAGNRAYRAKDVKLIKFIKFLLHEELFTIQGAKKKLSTLNLTTADSENPSEYFKIDSQMSLFEEEMAGGNKESYENKKLKEAIGSIKSDISHIKNLIEAL